MRTAAFGALNIFQRDSRGGISLLLDGGFALERPGLRPHARGNPFNQEQRMTDVQSVSAAGFFRHVADTLERTAERPYGPPVQADERSIAGRACVDLCEGDQDRGRALWKLIAADLGYMPRAAAVALIRASATTNLVPDVEAPEPR